MVQVSTRVFALVLTCIVHIIADDYDINPAEYIDESNDILPAQKRFDHFFNQRARDRYLIEQSQSPRRDQPTYKVKRFISQIYSQ